MNEHNDLLGKSFEFQYPEETFHVEINSETNLRWTRTKGENSGATDVEEYVFTMLGENLFMLTWVEAGGYSLSNVLDLTTNILTTHASQDREVFVNIGKVQLY